MHVRHTLAVAALAAVALVACAGEDEQESAGSPAAEGAPPAPTVTSFAPVMASSFEPASPSCNGFQTRGADAIRSVPARTGTYACKLCTDGSGAPVELSYEAFGLRGGTYRLTAWVRAKPTLDAPSRIRAALEARGPEGFDVAPASPIAPGDAWSQLDTTIALPKGADRLRLAIATESDVGITATEASAPATARKCFLVDDVLVERVGD